MKIKNILVLLMVGSLFLFTSCEEDLGTSNITIPESPDQLKGTDKYLYETYTKTFNVEVLYKWNQEESDLTKNLVPPYESQVEPYLTDVVKELWLDAYLTQLPEVKKDNKIITDSSFLKTYTPKQILLLGSANYNSDGTITLGTADAGKKITLYQVNDYTSGTASAISQAVQSVHVIHHEFAHILHQTKSFSEDYKKITPAYTSSWYLESDATAWANGFVTNYAMSSYEEDFVEMLSCMLTSTPTAWRNRIDNAPNDSARNALKEKEAIMINYMSSVWKIDMVKFQQVMTTALQGHSYLAEASVATQIAKIPDLPGLEDNNKVMTYAEMLNFCRRYSAFGCLHQHLPASWIRSVDSKTDLIQYQVEYEPISIKNN